MKIIGITPHNKKTGETPEELYLRKLGDLGHEVLVGEHFDTISEDTDVVVAMSEVSCKNAYEIAKKYDKPFFAHMEWLPYWRIFYEPEELWGFEKNSIYYTNKMMFIRMYSNYVYFWNKAHAKSLAAKCFNFCMKDFIGYDADIETKYIGPNTEKIVEYLKTHGIPEKKNEVTCVGRFVTHKRVHHVIEALKKINFKGKLNLVGYGPEKARYEYIKSGLNIEYYDSKDKFDCLARSKLCVSLWSGLVPAEAMYLGTPCVTYESPYMRELYGNTIFYAKNNDINDLSEMIEFCLNTDMEGIVAGGTHSIENNKINTHTVEDTVKLLEKLIKKAVDRKNESNTNRT